MEEWWDVGARYKVVVCRAPGLPDVCEEPPDRLAVSVQRGKGRECMLVLGWMEMGGQTWRSTEEEGLRTAQWPASSGGARCRPQCASRPGRTDGPHLQAVSEEPDARARRAASRHSFIAHFRTKESLMSLCFGCLKPTNCNLHWFFS